MGLDKSQKIALRQTGCWGIQTDIFEGLKDMVRPGNNNEPKEGAQEEKGWECVQLSLLQDLLPDPTCADHQHTVSPLCQEQSPRTILASQEPSSTSPTKDL